MITRLAWILVAIMLCASIHSSSIVVLIDVYEFSSSYRSLMIVLLVFCLIVFLMAMIIFLTRGGAKYQSHYLSFVSFVLYVHAILCLYASGATIYFMSAFPKRAGDRLALFKFFAILFAIVSVVFIYITTQVPHLVTFLRDFRRYAKSEQIFLPKFIFTCGNNRVENVKVVRQVSVKNDEKQPLMSPKDLEKGNSPPDQISPKVDSGKPPKKRRFFFGA
jgi:hypothetical protein